MLTASLNNGRPNDERLFELFLVVSEGVSASSVEDGVDEQKFGLSVEGLDFVLAL